MLIVQRVDLFYFSGTAQNGLLYIPAQGDPLLLIKKYMPRAKKESSINQIIEIKSIKEVPLLISDFFGSLPQTLAFEFDVIPVREFNFYKKALNTLKALTMTEKPHLLLLKAKVEFKNKNYKHVYDILKELKKDTDSLDDESKKLIEYWVKQNDRTA